MLVSFEQWTDDSLGPKWAWHVGRIIWGARPNWVYCRHICAELELSNNSPAVRKAVHFMRHQLRAPVMSQGSGYRWALEPDDLLLSIKHGHQRARANEEWANALEVIRREWIQSRSTTFQLEFSP